ncbi:MAG: apolipoprotein N-acyltransferase [Clostridia bacterium]|nr:apolipoprotein N-acyltransferase [Clostridia bacterium]
MTRSGFAESLGKLENKWWFDPALIVASSLLTALTMIFDLLSPIAFVSLSPLILVLMRRTEKGKKGFSNYMTAFLWSFVFYMTIYHWFWYLWPMDFMGVSIPMALLLTLLCWIGLSLLQTVGTAFVGLIFCHAYKKERMWSAPIIFACAYTFLEFMQSLTFAGVPWARLALTQTSVPAAIQSASLFGSLFVGFIIGLVNGLVALAIRGFVKNGSRFACFVRPAALALAIVMLNLGVGMTYMALHDEKSRGGFKITVVQGNISSNDKWADNSNANAINVYERLTLEADAKEHADIVLWPETVLTVAIKESPHYETKIKELAKSTGSVIFVGAFDVSETDEEYKWEDYNAIVAYFPDGSVESGSYKKRHLVPFGEYMPMRSVLEVVMPFMTELNMLGDDLTPGKDSEVVSTPFARVGRLICFDSIYPELARDSVSDGAEIILLSTNDSWYRDSASAYQHNSHAVLRAVENRRYIARAASTGISAFIDSEGRVLSALPPLKMGYLTASVFPHSERTLYSYVGDVIVLPCVAALVFFVCEKYVKSGKNKNKKPKN